MHELSGAGAIIVQIYETCSVLRSPEHGFLNGCCYDVQAMSRPIHILLQTTIPTVDDDWTIDRFSLLAQHLSSLRDESGAQIYEVTTRNRETNAQGDDAVLSTLDTSHFHQLWLFAVESGDGLTEADCRGITRFYQRGGGLLRVSPSTPALASGSACVRVGVRGPAGPWQVGG